MAGAGLQYAVGAVENSCRRLHRNGYFILLGTKAKSLHVIDSVVSSSF